MKELNKILRKIQIILLLLVSLMFNTPNAYAQENAASADGPMTDLYIVLGAGAAGAVLGLSTLSFEDEPSKNLKNVSMGAALGIILGVGIVIYNQATKTSSTIYSADIKVDTADSFARLSRSEFSKASLFDSYKQSEWLSFSTTF